MKEVVFSDRELMDLYRELGGPKGDRDDVLNAMKTAVEKSSQKSAYQIESLHALNSTLFLAMQCALIDVHQGGDPKEALQNWIEPALTNYCNEFDEHYANVTVSADDFYKQRMELNKD